MPSAEIIVLPVIRVERGEFYDGNGEYDRTNVVDLNAWVYGRERRRVERREMGSLLDGETA